MRYLLSCILIIVALVNVHVFSQTVEQPWLPEQVEEMDETEAERIHELAYREAKTISINGASLVQLLDIPGMTEGMALNIISFRDSLGYFLSIYEMMSIPDITREYLQGIAPWLTFAPSGNTKSSHLVSFRTFTRSTVTNEEVTGSNKQVGSPHKIAIRYKGEYRGFTAGIKAEKDAGEPFGGSYRPEGFDFYSAYLEYRGKGLIRQIIAGDYRIATGHGLVCNQLFAAGNNSSALYQPHEARTSRPHTSMDEHHFFRGASMTLKYLPVQITLFGSVKPLDGNITQTDSTNEKTLFISSIQKSGIHATPAELEDRHAFREYAWGGILKYHHKRFQAGVNLLNIYYDAEIKPSETFSNRHKFKGNKINSSSITLGWYNRTTGFTTEVAVSQGVTALSLVMATKISDNTSLWISGRRFAPHYHAPYANTLSRSTTPSGEEGINLVIAYSPTYGRVIRAVADVGRMFYTGYAPASGRLFRNISLEASGTQGMVNSMVRVTYLNLEEMTTAIPAESSTPGDVYHTDRYNARASFLITPAENIKFYLRADYNYIPGYPRMEGWLMVAGAERMFMKKRLTVSLRHYVINTDHYDVRIYTHEQEAPGAFTMNMLYGKGTSTYLLVGLKLLKNIRIWIKAGYTSTVKPATIHETTKKYDLSFQINVML